MSRPTSADVVICGAGIAGISAAYELAVRRGVGDVVLVDDRPPLSLTSDKSTECYRNWWPGPGDAMVRFMNRSIGLLEELARESGNYFSLNRKGYVFLTADPEQAMLMERSAHESSELGAGELRVHRGQGDDPPFIETEGEAFEGQPEGADLVLDRRLILERYPFLNPDVTALLNPRRCGWLSAQQLGMYLLEKSRQRGVRVLRGRVEDVTVRRGRIEEVVLSGGEIDRIASRRFVNAAGPGIADVSAMLGVQLPVFHELHWKIYFDDHLGVVPRDAPLMIWNDPVTLAWTAEERAELERDPEMQWLLGKLPAGVHFRPEGGEGSRTLLLLWTYELDPRDPDIPLPPVDAAYPAVALRGLQRMIPGLEVYFEKAREPLVDGGYYTKTRENRPLICPLPVEGSYLLGALSGFGIMASQAAGELLGAHVTGGELPAYAQAFSLDRYEDPAYQRLLENWEATSGQL